MHSLRILLLICLFCLALIAQGQTDTARAYHIRKSTQHIKIDGKLDDPDWQQAQKEGGFWQQFPYDTSASVTRTEIMMTYDAHHIYVAAICYDTFGGNFVVSSLKRDFTYATNDAFMVSIDPFNDKINGFCFGVNPYGAQLEGLLQNGGSFDITTNWDNKWFSEVKRYEGYWVAEFRIPFKTLRYKEGITQWGVNFSRNNLKINENTSWSRVPRNFNVTSLAYTGKLLWDAPPPAAGQNISLIPYAITRYSENFKNNTKGLLTANAGMDAKIAVTPSLNLDLTVNPDFSQVDVDRQVTNLSRFSLFFPEQRQFFIENSDLFSRFGFSQIRPFFSRRIGLKNGSSVTIPIIAGARLSGKLNKDWRMGLMNIQTGAYDKDGVKANAENYTVAAVQRQVFSRSNLSAIVVNKQNVPGPDSGATAYNRVVGFDFDLASKDNTWMGKFFFHHSFSPHQPQNAYAHASWLSYNTPRWFIMWNHEYVGNNYRAHVGFVPRQTVYDEATDNLVPMTFWRIEPEITHTFYPENSRIYRVSPGFYVSGYADSSITVNDILYRPYLDIQFMDRSFIGFGYNENFTRLYFPIDITGTGNTPLPAGGYTYRSFDVNYNSNTRKPFNWRAEFSAGTFYNGRSISYSAAINYRAQPWGNFSLTYEANELDLPKPYGYTRLILIGPRAELTFSRNLFFTTFVQYNTQVDNVNVNARLQWRFAPMSDVFIVYGDNYAPIPQRRMPDFRVKDRGVVVKLVYWLGV